MSNDRMWWDKGTEIVKWSIVNYHRYWNCHMIVCEWVKAPKLSNYHLWMSQGTETVKSLFVNEQRYHNCQRSLVNEQGTELSNDRLKIRSWGVLCHQRKIYNSVKLVACHWHHSVNWGCEYLCVFSRAWGKKLKFKKSCNTVMIKICPLYSSWVRGRRSVYK
jgi:hypothetical protein